MTNHKITTTHNPLPVWPLLRAMLFGITLLSAGITFWLFSRPVNEPAYVEEQPHPLTLDAPCTIAHLFDTVPNIFAPQTTEMPDANCKRLKINPIGGSLGKVFNDSNNIQLKAARALGISPITTLSGAWKLRRPIVKVSSCPEYYVDTLTHSYPYLVPEAGKLLADIGSRFNRELRERGGGKYRIKVTSLTRTPLTVKQLRRVNRNATQESTHLYGTTFDISYLKFVCDDTLDVHRSQEDLKNLLAEVLNDLRNEGRCYVKHERKQSCFHITTIK